MNHSFITMSKFRPLMGALVMCNFVLQASLPLLARFEMGLPVLGDGHAKDVVVYVLLAIARSAASSAFFVRPSKIDPAPAALLFCSLSLFFAFTGRAPSSVGARLGLCESVRTAH